MTSTANSIRTESVIRKLEELGFSFYQDSKKSRCFRRGTDRVYLRKHKQMPCSVVKSVLHQAGCSHEEIERFVANCK